MAHSFAQLHHRIFTHIRTLTSKATLQLLVALELPEGTHENDRLTFKASTMELWNVLNSLASFDISSIDHQYRRVANSLTRIAYVVDRLKLVSPCPRIPFPIHSYELIVKVLCSLMHWRLFLAF